MFRRLALPEQDVGEIIESVVPAGSSEGEPVSNTWHGWRWTITPVSPGWLVLSRGIQERCSSGAATQVMSPEGVFVDWTRFDVPDLSPWIRFIRDYDWASTALGAMEAWPAELRQNVFSIMQNNQPRLLVWGEHGVFIYNEACVPIFGDKHPSSLGSPWYVAWAELQDSVGPIIKAAYAGKTTTVERMPIEIVRGIGGLSYEQTYFDFSLLPIMDRHGRVVGCLDEFSESTKLVRGERRRTSVLKLSESITQASTLKGLWDNYLAGLEFTAEDLPFALLYSVADDVAERPSALVTPVPHGATQRKATLEGTSTLRGPFEATLLWEGAQDALLYWCRAARRTAFTYVEAAE